MVTSRRGLRFVAGFGSGLCILLMLIPSANTRAEEAVAKALSTVSTCETDLNGDKIPDIAMVAETARGWEVIVLIRKAHNYQVFVLSEGKVKMDLVCRLANTITEMKNKESVRKTNGSYLLLQKNGKPTVAYTWARNTFQEVWMEE